MWILWLGILRFVNILVVMVWIVPLMHVVMIGHEIVHPCVGE
jgi:hypothetical protein